MILLAVYDKLPRFLCFLLICCHLQCQVYVAVQMVLSRPRFLDIAVVRDLAAAFLVPK